MEINQLLDALRRFREARNWKQFHLPKDLAISISIESAELLEIFQWKSADVGLTEHEISKATDEVADILIYTILFCDALGIELGEAAEDKIKRNELRFPIDASYGIAKSRTEVNDDENKR